MIWEGLFPSNQGKTFSIKLQWKLSVGSERGISSAGKVSRRTQEPCSMLEGQADNRNGPKCRAKFFSSFPQKVLLPSILQFFFYRRTLSGTNRDPRPCRNDRPWILIFFFLFRTTYPRKPFVQFSSCRRGELTRFRIYSNAFSRTEDANRAFYPTERRDAILFRRSGRRGETKMELKVSRIAWLFLFAFFVVSEVKSA